MKKLNERVVSVRVVARPPDLISTMLPLLATALIPLYLNKVGDNFEVALRTTEKVVKSFEEVCTVLGRGLNNLNLMNKNLFCIRERAIKAIANVEDLVIQGAQAGENAHSLCTSLQEVWNDVQRLRDDLRSATRLLDDAKSSVGPTRLNENISPIQEFEVTMQALQDIECALHQLHGIGREVLIAKQQAESVTVATESALAVTNQWAASAKLLVAESEANASCSSP